MQFSTTLVREKFIIKDIDKPADAPVVATSNRMILALTSAYSGVRETFVVRAQNMHTCVRMAAMIVRAFQDDGPIMSRARYGWNDDWRDITKGFEKDWNPNIWGVVYFNGRIVFSDGEHHPFLDVIEQCDIKNKGEYAQSITFAEAAFKQAGKNVTIDYDSNIALVVSYKDEEAKCGVILRTANKTTTFNFSAKQKSKDSPVKMSHALTTSAAFLEGIQLAFQVGMYNRKLQYGLIKKYTDDDRKGQRSTERVAALNRAISQFEQMYNVVFRPERPSFPKAIEEAEIVARGILATQVQEMIAKGELNPNDWIE